MKGTIAPWFDDMAKRCPTTIGLGIVAGAVLIVRALVVLVSWATGAIATDERGDWLRPS